MSEELKFEELQKKLKKVLNTERFRFIFIFYPNENLREEIKNYICEKFTYSDKITLELKNNSYQDIASILYENDKSFIFIDDFFEVLENADAVPRVLNDKNIKPENIVYNGDLKKKDLEGFAKAFDQTK